MTAPDKPRSESERTIKMDCPSCYRYGAPRTQHVTTINGRDYPCEGAVILDPDCARCGGKGYVECEIVERRA